MSRNIRKFIIHRAKQLRAATLGLWAVAFGLLGTSSVTQAMPATLYNAGNGLINDVLQNLVWLQDANLAATNTFGLSVLTDLGTYPGDPSGVHGFIDDDGTMNWVAAMFWIDAMNAAKYKGYNDWRLPTVDTYSKNQCENGRDDPDCWIVVDYCEEANTGTNCGFNVLTATSELAHLWYRGLGNAAYCDADGNCPQPGFGPGNTGPFLNIQSNAYWSGTPYAPDPLLAWSFFADSGWQFRLGKDSAFVPWAVREGQHQPAETVPLPGTAWLVALGVPVLALGRKKAWPAVRTE